MKANFLLSYNRFERLYAVKNAFFEFSPDFNLENQKPFQYFRYYCIDRYYWWFIYLTFSFLFSNFAKSLSLSSVWKVKLSTISIERLDAKNYLFCQGKITNSY